MTDSSVPLSSLQKKVCTKCKLLKPLSEFYPRSGQPQHYNSQCKDCMKARNKTAVKLPVGESSVESEALVIRTLRRMGIPALPGRDLSAKYYDVLAWGIVGLEVKQSALRDNRLYSFVLTARQQQRGIQGDLVVLICRTDNGDTFHIFPVTHPIFYDADGKVKSAVIYFPDPAHRKTTKRGKPITHLTAELMEAHRDAWHLIEDVRLTKSAALRATS